MTDSLTPMIQMNTRRVTVEAFNVDITLKQANNMLLIHSHTLSVRHVLPEVETNIWS